MASRAPSAPSADSRQTSRQYWSSSRCRCASTREIATRANRWRLGRLSPTSARERRNITGGASPPAAPSASIDAKPAGSPE